MEITIAALVGLSLGFVISRLLQRNILRKKIGTLEAQNEAKAKAIMRDANKKINRIKKNRQLEIKDKEIESRERVRQYSEGRKRQLLNFEQQLKQKEANLKNLKDNLKEEETRLNTRREQLDAQKKRFVAFVERTKQKQADLESATNKLETQEQKLQVTHEEYLTKIATVADQDLKNIQTEFMKEIQIKLEQEENKMVLQSKERIKDKTNAILRDLRDQLDFESRKILLDAIQKIKEEDTYDLMTSIFYLDNDGQKGKIIGREGKNIQTLETKLNVNLIIDDTPRQVMIVGFDPYKRELTKLTLKQIIKQGLVTIPYIEEVIKKVRADMEKHTFEIGNNLLKKLQIENMHPNLIRLISKMAYYNDNKYNLLEYTKLVVKVARNLAAAIKMDAEFIKRAAVLQNIGKIYQQEQDKHYTITSSELAKAYGEKGLVCHTIAAYSEGQTDNFNTAILQIANRVVKLRLGVSEAPRKIDFKRVENIEDIPINFEGVKESFVLDSGDELYVIVNSDLISEPETYELSDKITQKIEEHFPDVDKMKVTIIRKNER